MVVHWSLQLGTEFEEATRLSRRRLVTRRVSSVFEIAVQQSRRPGQLRSVTSVSGGEAPASQI